MLPRTASRLLRLTRHFNASASVYSTSQHTMTNAAVDKKPSEPEVEFEMSPIPSNPLGEGRWIRTAAALIIGDEILNGKTVDTNSTYFARFCFERGIELKRIEVIADDEDEIIEASRRMAKNYDFVVTTGGIGPTHDDITYESLAKGFGQPLEHHAETLRRMAELSRNNKLMAQQTEEQRTARFRMALLPASAEALFVTKDLWVPVVRLEGKLCVFPGVPRLFRRLLDSLVPYLPLPPPSARPFRHLIFTTLPESNIAPYLTSLQNRVKDAGVKIGSYPLIRKGVTVSLIGPDEAMVRELGVEVAKELKGEVVTEEQQVGDEMDVDANLPAPGKK